MKQLGRRCTFNGHGSQKPMAVDMTREKKRCSPVTEAPRRRAPNACDLDTLLLASDTSGEPLDGRRRRWLEYSMDSPICALQHIKQSFRKGKPIN